MTAEPHRNRHQQILDEIVGHPPLIQTHTEIGSLMEDFAGAVTIFETPGTPKSIMQTAYTSLTERVKLSRQQHAQTCLDNFNRHYADKIAGLKDPSASSGTDHRLPRTKRPAGRAHGRR